MEKVKTDVPADLADELAQLRIVADVPAFAKGNYQHHLRFRCITCERGLASHTFDRVAMERLGGSSFNCAALYCVPSGYYPLIEFTNASHAVVLPFDLRKWRGHILHDVRPEWDHQFICARGVRVQEWPVQPNMRTIEIVGETRRPPHPPFKRLRDIDGVSIRRNALVRVLSTEQYFRWLPESLLTDDGVLVLKSDPAPRVGRFVLDDQAWSPGDADFEAEAL